MVDIFFNVLRCLSAQHANNATRYIPQRLIAMSTGGALTTVTAVTVPELRR